LTEEEEKEDEALEDTSLAERRIVHVRDP